MCHVVDLWHTCQSDCRIKLGSLPGNIAQLQRVVRRPESRAQRNVNNSFVFTA